MHTSRTTSTTSRTSSLAVELSRRTGMDRAFFCNSGTEANEALLKLARHHFFGAGQKDRVRIIAFHNAFHGRTLGALSMTGTPKYREGFGELGAVTHVTYGDLDAVKKAMGPDVAAIIVEPLQGEGGVSPRRLASSRDCAPSATSPARFFSSMRFRRGSGGSGGSSAARGKGFSPTRSRWRRGSEGASPSARC